MTGLTLDAGALIGLERRSKRVTQLLRTARDEQLDIRIPAAVVAQVWRGGPRAAPLARLLRARDVDLVSLTAVRARAVGQLLGRTAGTDVVDASVIVCAREHADAVLTSDPDDLRRLDPTLRLVAL